MTVDPNEMSATAQALLKEIQKSQGSIMTDPTVTDFAKTAEPSAQ